MIVRPQPEEKVEGPDIQIEGRAWHHEPIASVQLSVDGGESWKEAVVDERVDFSWQRFSLTLHLEPGNHTAIARAVSFDGATQPLSGRRNHCHSLLFEVA